MLFDEIPTSLVAKAQRGDASALEDLCGLSVEPGFALLISLLRNREDAADVLQDCLIRLCRFLPRLDKPENYGAWFSRMIINQANTCRVKRARVVSMDPQVMQESLDEGNAVSAHQIQKTNPRDTAAAREHMASLQAAVLALPERQRTAIVLFEMEGLKISEIAQTMEISPGAVKFHIHEARKRLRSAIQYPMAATGDGRLTGA